MRSILLETLIDFALLLVDSYDALNGVAGAYAHRIFVEELGAKESSLLNCVPKVHLEAFNNYVYCLRSRYLLR